MDSLTQIVLGAAVGEVVLGRKVGNKAMLWGAIAGTIPDLDVYQSLFFDTLRANELHRGFSHSILFSLIFAPLIAWLIKTKEKVFLMAILTTILAYPFITIENNLARVSIACIVVIANFFIYRSNFNSTLATNRDWCKLAFWALITHPLLDCHTTWGTQILWPLPHRLAWNNIFVADPLYTLPFLIFVIIAAFYKRESIIRRRLNWVGIIISCFYMLWTLGVKWHVHQHFAKNLVYQGVDYKRITTTPTPLNSILWRATADTDSFYYVGLYSLFDKKENEIKFTSIDHNHYLLEDLEKEDVIRRLKFLSKNWYVVRQRDSSLDFYDARFGPLQESDETIDYIFGYNLTREGGVLEAKQQERNATKMQQAFQYLIERLMGNKKRDL